MSPSQNLKQQCACTNNQRPYTVGKKAHHHMKPDIMATQKPLPSPPQATFSPSSKRGLIILSAPRSTSTLFMRLLSQHLERRHSPGTVLLEPSTVLFYKSNHRNAPNFYPHPSLPQTPSALRNLLHRTITKNDHHFVIKDLAYQCAPYLSEDMIEIMGKLAHIVFLIKNPADTIPSGMHPYLKTFNTVDGYESYEAGFVSLKTLYERFTKICGMKPWVVEAETYLDNPKGVIGRLCRTLGWPWNEGYLKLVEKDFVCGKGGMYEKEVSVWGDVWYGSAFEHRGVVKRGKDGHRKSVGGKGKYKEVWGRAEHRVVELIKMHLPAYQWLKENGKRLEVLNDDGMDGEISQKVKQMDADSWN